MIIHVIVYELKLAETYSNKVFESVCVLGGGGDTYPKYRMAKYRKKHSPIFKILIHGDWGCGGGVNA